MENLKFINIHIKNFENLYSQSPFLLNNAFENEIGKTVNKIDLNSNGKLYKLPNNILSLIFLIKIFVNFKKFSNIFLNKKWNIGQINIEDYFSKFDIKDSNKIKIQKIMNLLLILFFKRIINIFYVKDW